jgi:hypothetical protein
MDCGELIGISLGLLGVFVALCGIFAAFWVPIQIERLKRPVLELVPEDSITYRVRDGRASFAKIAIRNLPIRPDDSPWYFPKADVWLLRSTASGCRVTVDFADLETGPFLTNRQMRWDGTAEPLTADGRPDVTKVPQSLSLDVAPDSVETIAVAVKYAGEESMYSFGAWSYFHGGKEFADPGMELSKDEYRITVRAKAGGISEQRTFRLRNYGTGIDDFRVVQD